MRPRRLAWAVLAIVSTALGCSKILGIEEGQLAEQPGSQGGAGVGGAATSTAATGGLGPGECVESGDCPDPVDSACQSVECVAGACDVSTRAAGEPTASQVAGDCKITECDGNGGVADVPGPDPYDDGKECTLDTCAGGVPANKPKAAGSKCKEDGGKVCDAAGACVECLDNGDCSGQVCDERNCVPATCVDGVKNGNETDLDCGGSCNRCADGAGCSTGSDCDSKICQSGVCKTANCTDGAQNGSETDIDCGGFCPACASGKSCATGADCQSQVCTGGICQAPKCTDGKDNGSETDVDCGGTCAGCADGKGCVLGSDCAGLVCTGGVCCTPQSQAGTCAGKCGMVVNNCGQMVGCGGCPAGETCQQNTCVCVPEAPSVTCAGQCGTIQNNCGQAVDCGPCTTAASSAAASSSSSGGGGGGGPTCSDGVQNGDETDMDCGGSCPGCAACAKCGTTADCAGGLTCDMGICSPCGAPDAGPD